MSDICLGGGDGSDFARVKMNAMSQHGFGREQSAFLVNVSVIARAHKKMMHLLDFLPVFGQMGLQVSVKSRGQFGRAAHHFFRAGDGEARTKSIFESTVLGAMPLPAKSLTFQE